MTELEPLEITSGHEVGEPSDEAQRLAASQAGSELADGAGETVSRAEFDQLKAERDQLVDRIARLQAEFENARKRAERERLEFRDYATGSVVEQFLPVLDNFELALKSDGTAEQLRSGVELIVKQMEEILRQMQVSRFRQWARHSIRACTRRWARWSATTCPTSMWPRRFAAATSCASGCCGRRWCAWLTIPNRRANEF